MCIIFKEHLFHMYHFLQCRLNRSESRFQPALIQGYSFIIFMSKRLYGAASGFYGDVGNIFYNLSCFCEIPNSSK